MSPAPTSTGSPAAPAGRPQGDAKPAATFEANTAVNTSAAVTTGRRAKRGKSNASLLPGCTGDRHFRPALSKTPAIYTTPRTGL